MSLLVTNTVIVDDNAMVIRSAAWRVAVESETEPETALALPLEFGREPDAERAKDALERAGLASEAALRFAGRGTVVRIMGESLAW